ncbi:hypothetical protein [Streptomyces lushanensis]|nr:hypothetical protein [Streptomyces lushanensis]
MPRTSRKNRSARRTFRPAPLPRPRLLTKRRHIDLLRLRNGCAPAA